MKVRLNLALGVIALSIVSQSALGQDLKLNDIKAQNGVLLTAEELQKLLPGAKVTSRTKAGSTRYWTNEPDGKFVASSDNRGNISARRASTAEGVWSIGPNGAYCVTLEWTRNTEQWCRHIFRVGDTFFGVKTLNDGATDAHSLEFSGR